MRDLLSNGRAYTSLVELAEEDFNAALQSLTANHCKSLKAIFKATISDFGDTNSLGWADPREVPEDY